MEQRRDAAARHLPYWQDYTGHSLASITRGPQMTTIVILTITINTLTAVLIAIIAKMIVNRRRRKAKFIKDAVFVVDAFDQANTGGAIENTGSRGMILRDAVNDLRRELNRDIKRTILTCDEAKPRSY